MSSIVHIDKNLVLNIIYFLNTSLIFILFTCVLKSIKNILTIPSLTIYNIF